MFFQSDAYSSSNLPTASCVIQSQQQVQQLQIQQQQLQQQQPQQKTTILSREERLRLRKEEKRKRKIQEIRAGIKRFISMLFSHINLSVLVIAYTIMGGLMFRAIECDHENHIKKLAVYHKELAGIELLQSVIGEIQSTLTTSRSDETWQFLNFIQTYLNYTHDKVQLEQTYFVWNSESQYNNFTELNGTQINQTTNQVGSVGHDNEWDVLATPDYTNMTELEMLMADQQRYLHNQFVRMLHYHINVTLENFTKRVMDFIENDGWNGKYPMEDIKWSFAGAVLYAITVVTTIGYGHATPRTNLGKFITIIYALIGIPLMFLYLSNIGDYLADIFRVVYSRTCRASCETFCSASTFSQIKQFLLRSTNSRHLGGKKVRLDEEPLNEDEVEPNLTHSHARRRKRVLLKSMTMPLVSADENPQLDKQESIVSNTVTADEPEVPNVENSFFVQMKTQLKQKVEQVGFRQRMERVAQWEHQSRQWFLEKPAIAWMRQKWEKNIKSNLEIVFNPLLKCLGQTKQLLFTSNSAENSNGSYAILGNLAPGYSLSTSDSKPKSVGVDLTAMSNTAQNSIVSPLIAEPSQSKASQLEYCTIARDPSIGTTLSTYASHSALLDSKPSPSMQNKAQYFTFDGQHRKFYMVARYIRSAQRERRYKRRLKKRLQEQNRTEYNRLANEKLYGTLTTKSLAKHSATHSPYKRHSPVAVDDPTNVATWNDDDECSMQSETSLLKDNGQIPLLCWRDIDLDLEVRSIDDPAEILRLSRLSLENSKNSIWTTLPDTYEPAAAQNPKTPLATVKPQRSNKKHQSRTLDPSSSSCVQVPLSTNPPQSSKYLGVMTKSNTICPPSNVGLDQLASPSHSKIYHQPAFISPPSPNATFRRPSQYFHTMPNSISLQPDILRNFMNPPSHLQTSGLVPLSNLEKPGLMGKSRLSLASSRGDLDSEIIFQLSYYSQQGSQRSEEDLSFFSYRDGFSAEEDVSKVTVPISLSLFIMTTYILIGAVVFSSWEDSDYLKWSYFCFITLSTIGFGDIVPGTKIDSTNPKEKLVIISLYVAIGLSVFAMCFKLMQEEVVDKMRWLASNIGIFKKKQTEAAEKSNF